LELKIPNVERMLREMSAEQFLSWQAFARHRPFGQRWQNWQSAFQGFLIDRLRDKPRGHKHVALSDFFWEPPKPLYHERKRRHAKSSRAKR
jgi:hypothetical protein